MRSQKFFDAASVFVLLVAVAVGSRVVKETLDVSLPNFHAVTATALFAGFYFSRRSVAMLVPLFAMAISDLVFGWHEPLVMTSVYGCLAAPVLLRGWMRSADRQWSGAIGASLTSSLLFFVVTNLAVWWTSYSHSWTGLTRCYIAAIPFFGYTLLGDLMSTCVLFAVYAATTTIGESRREFAAA